MGEKTSILSEYWLSLLHVPQFLSDAAADALSCAKDSSLAGLCY